MKTSELILDYLREFRTFTGGRPVCSTGLDPC